MDDLQRAGDRIQAVYDQHAGIRRGVDPYKMMLELAEGIEKIAGRRRARTARNAGKRQRAVDAYEAASVSPALAMALGLGDLPPEIQVW